MATVLVVDDEPIVREVVVRYLTREGYRTLEAADGNAGRRRPRALPLDPRALGAPGDHADGAGRGSRPNRRPRARRGRLRDEAVLAPRARGARSQRPPSLWLRPRAGSRTPLRRRRARAR